jgi:hypothetical protein
MRRRLSLVLLVALVALGGWAIASRSGGGPDGVEALKAAPGQLVISEAGRVVGWENRRVSYSLDKRRRCYLRSTEFERADAVEVRRDIVVARAFLHEAEVQGRVIRWRGPPAEDG